MIVLHIHTIPLRCMACALSPRLTKLKILPPTDDEDVAFAVCSRHEPQDNEERQAWFLRMYESLWRIEL